VDESLRLLMRLRLGATLRRWKKTMSRPKGIILGLVTAMLFVPWFFSIGISLYLGFRAPMEPIRRFAPAALFAFTVLSLAFSAGEQALYFAPAEVSFLFAGPYRKRQLLVYKLVVTLWIGLFSAVFFALASTTMAPNMGSAFVGSFLILLFFQASQMVVGLGASTLGALAWSRGRRVFLVGVVAVVGLALASAGRGLFEIGDEGLEALGRVERSPITTVVLAPFRWFILTFTAESFFDLIRWGTLAAAVDAGLIALIFALDASYLEAAASASAKRFAKMQRMMGGGGGIKGGARATGRFRFRPPAPPWWGGVGPNLWRQMTTALGSPGRLVGLVAMLSALPIFLAVVGRNGEAARPLTYLGQWLVIWISIAMSGLLPFDFRGDVDVMEELKALPIGASRLALGQILTPALLATVAQTFAIGLTMAVIGGGGAASWVVLAFLAPINLMFYAIENLLFLWYPSRLVAGQFDVIAVGRQILFLMAKVLGLVAGIGAAALVGLPVYFLAGHSLVAASVLAWFALAATALAMVPLVGQAFLRFDVSRDIPA